MTQFFCRLLDFFDYQESDGRIKLKNFYSKTSGKSVNQSIEALMGNSKLKLGRIVMWY